MSADFWQRQLILLWNSLQVSLFTTLLAGIAGVLLALLVLKSPFAERKFYMAMMAAFLLLPMHSVVTGWYAVYWRMALEIPDTLLAALLMAPTYVPLVFWITALALALVDRELEDQGRLDSSKFSSLLNVTLPAAWPVVGAGLLLIFILSMGEITATDVQRVRTFAEEIFTQFALQKPDQAIGVACVLFVLMLAATALLIRAFRGIDEISIDGLARRLDSSWKFKPRFGVRMLPPVLILLLYGIPLGYLFRCLKTPANLFYSWEIVGQDILLSCAVGVVGALLICLLAPGFAWIVSRGIRQRKHRRLVLFCLVFLTMLPAPLTGFCVLMISRQPFVLAFFSDSILIVVFVHLVRFLPLAILVSWPIVKRLPVDIEHMSRLDNARGINFFAMVLYPLCIPLCAILFMLCFAWITSELGATAIVMPPGFTTMISVRISDLLHIGVLAETAGAALLMMIPSLLGGFILFIFAGKIFRN